MVPSDFKSTPGASEKTPDQTADFTFDGEDSDLDAFEDSKETLDEDNQDLRTALDFGTPLIFKSSFGQNVARSVSKPRSRSNSIKRPAANSLGSKDENKTKSLKSGLPVKNLKQ